MLRNLKIKWLLFRGKRERKRRRAAEAIRYFEQILAIDPQRVVATAQIGCCLYDLQRYDEAVDVFQGALQRAPDYAEAHAHLAFVFMQLERNQEAYDSIQRAFRMKPKLSNEPYWLSLLGYSSGKIRRWEVALGAFRNLTQLDQGDASA